MHYPPNVNIEFNTSGHPVNYFGSDVHLLNAFVMKMNFTVKFDSGSKTKTKTAYFIQQLLRNKMQIALIRSMVSKVSKDLFLEHLVLGLGTFSALSLKMQKQVDFDELSFLRPLPPLQYFLQYCGC